jgi:uncharacterized protein YhaN
MEVRELNLVAFGPFSERRLVFDQESCGLHIVYGPNEAGKSSALRGLKALLYNVDERTSDDFIHAKDKLRVAGCLRTVDGEELCFSRRKGRKNTLLSPDGVTLDDNALVPFLQGVTAELFEMLFGIDHRALVQGGQEILEQKGEVGQALFSASLGSHALHGVLAQLDEEAGGLFKARGSAQVINAALKAYSETSKEIRERSLSSREWDEHRRALARTNKELDQIQAELASQRVEVNRLKRIQRVLPKLARRHGLLQKIEALGEVLILSNDFGERRHKTLAELETAQAILQKATGRLNDQQEQLEKVSVHGPTLDLSESIEDLHARLGGHRKAMQDRPYLEAERKQLAADAESLLKDVRPDLRLSDLDVLRPIFSGRQRVTELGAQHPVLVSRLKETDKSLREIKIQLRETRKEREDLPDVAPPKSLHGAIVAARKLGDLDQTIQAGRRDVDTLKAQCAADLARLALWSGSLDELSRLPVPNRESISKFDDAYAAVDQGMQRLREKQDDTEEGLREVSQRLDEIQRGGIVPTEDDLLDARSAREQAWKLLRRQWLDGEDIDTQAQEIDAERALPDAFEYRMITADELADRLRREADRTHTKANLLAGREIASQRAGQIAQQFEACNDEKKRIDADWEALWAPCGIQHRTPREMRAWLESLEKLRERASQLSTRQQEVSALEHTCSTHIRTLKQQLQGVGKEAPETTSLEAMLLECEDVVAALEDIKRRQETLDKEIQALDRKLQSAVAEHEVAIRDLDAWKEQWKEAVAGFGLKGDALPAEATDVIEKLRQLFAKQGEVDKLQIRIQAIDKDAETFRDQVGSVVANIAPELADQSADDAVIRLNALLSENRTRQSRLQQIEEQLQQARQDIQDSDAVIQAMTERLQGLCQEARRDSAAELEEAERRSTEYVRLKTEVDGVEQELLSTGEGAALAELEAEAETIDPDVLPGQIQALTEKIEEELEPRRMTLAESKGRETKELELMDCSDEAAALADQGHSILASIRSSSERYVRLKLAARILRDEIERYRKENQGPLVKRASEHFAVLTRGSFEGLRTDFNEKDEPVLVGIRPNQERVHVEGMSSGTRDQLYLALRLASLEKYMESSEPMPFIVDDILVDFDDERSNAALSALAALAEKTQVILFTHHPRVVEQARGLRTSAQVQVHEL